MYDLSPTAVQLAYRNAIQDSTDATGKEIKSEDEIKEAGRKAIADEKAAVLAGESGSIRKYKEGFDEHLINGTLGKGSKGVVGGHNFDSFKKVLTDAGFNIDDDTGVKTINKFTLIPIVP